MNNKKINNLTKGAMLIALFGVLGVINLYTGTMFDVLFSYLIAILMVWYTKERTIKEAMSVLIGTAIVLFLVGEIFFMIFTVMTMTLGITYGELLKRGISDKKISLILMGISAIKNFIIFFIVGQLIGISTFTEAIEIHKMIINLIPGLKAILNPTITFILLAIFLFFAETSILVSYSRLLFKRFSKNK